MPEFLDKARATIAKITGVQDQIKRLRSDNDALLARNGQLRGDISVKVAELATKEAELEQIKAQLKAYTERSGGEAGLSSFEVQMLQMTVQFGEQTIGSLNTKVIDLQAQLSEQQGALADAIKQMPALQVQAQVKVVAAYNDAPPAYEAAKDFPLVSRGNPFAPAPSAPSAPVVAFVPYAVPVPVQPAPPPKPLSLEDEWDAMEAGHLANLQAQQAVQSAALINETQLKIAKLQGEIDKLYATIEGSNAAITNLLITNLRENNTLRLTMAKQYGVALGPKTVAQTLGWFPTNVKEALHLAKKNPMVYATITGYMEQRDQAHIGLCKLTPEGKAFFRKTEKLPEIFQRAYDAQNFRAAAWNQYTTNNYPEIPPHPDGKDI